MGKDAGIGRGQNNVKRILVDGTYLSMQMKGVGRYTANVLRDLAELDAINEYLILVREDVPLPAMPQNVRFQYIPIPLHNHYVHGLWILPHQAQQLHADVAWIPYETTLGILPCPYLVVCHDVPQMITRAQSAAGNRLSWIRRIIVSLDSLLTQRSLHNASVVFANSHFVGNWLRNDLGIPAEHVRYAPCAPGADFANLAQSVDRKAVRRKLDCPEGYILIFATGDQRENLDTALRVFDELVAQGIHQNLVIAGVRHNAEIEIRTHVERRTWANRVRLIPFYGEDQVRNLTEVYAGASVYLDLSLHEGFGMQVIEAMACGTPVVCSDRGALPEVAGTAAVLVDPLDFLAIANATRRILTDSIIANSCVAKSQTQAAQFNWRQTAHTILQAIETI